PSRSAISASPPGEVLSRRKSGISAASASTAATLHFLTIDFTNSPFIESERCQIEVRLALKPVVRQRGKNGASATHVKRHLFGGHCPDIRQPHGQPVGDKRGDFLHTQSHRFTVSVLAALSVSGSSIAVPCGRITPSSDRPGLASKTVSTTPSVRP